MTESEAQIKISRARIKLQKENPFFAYLSLFLKPKEVKCSKKWKEGGFGMGVDIHGNLYYNPDFVNGLSELEMQGVICHEVLHLALLHFARTKNYNRQICNISQDICVNEILKDNNFILPKEAIWSNEKREVEVFGKKIKNCNKKTFEEIYFELIEEIKDKIKKAIKNGTIKYGSGDGEGIEIDLDELGDYEVDGSSIDGKGKVRNFDGHIKAKGENGKELTEEEKGSLEKEWMGRTVEASQMAKMRGNVPVGMERLIGKLFESKIKWKQLLTRYIQNSIPSDYSWSKCSKKSISCKIFLPSEIKERIEIFVCVDLSGSIGQDEMTEFLSEICGIAKTYREKIKFHLWTHETEVNDKYIVENGSVKKILSLKLHGGGGTSHIDCFEQLRKEKDCKVCIFFTDGFSNLNEIDFNKNKFESIFVISKNGSDEQLKGKKVKVIKLDR